MRFIIILLAATLLLGTSDHVMAGGQEQKESSVFKDDQSYWNRLLSTEQSSLTPAPTPSTPAPYLKTPPPASEPPISKPPTGVIDVGFASVDVECIPSEGFDDCNIIPSIPTDCNGEVSLLTFRFRGGDCLDSNNIQLHLSTAAKTFSKVLQLPMTLALRPT